MNKKTSKSETRRLDATVELKSFLYPNIGLNGIAIKAPNKEEADEKARVILAKLNQPVATQEEVEAAE